MRLAGRVSAVFLDARQFTPWRGTGAEQLAAGPSQMCPGMSFLCFINTTKPPPLAGAQELQLHQAWPLPLVLHLVLAAPGFTLSLRPPAWGSKAPRRAESSVHDISSFCSCH